MPEITQILSKVEKYYSMCKKFLLDLQDPITGLLPASLYKGGPNPAPGSNFAWIRDNVYCSICIWALSICYRKMSEILEVEHRKIELEKSAVKIMRSLLLCMMRQSKKVEQFKNNPDKTNSLHSVYSISTCESVVGDTEWGHLQIDSISLYLLILTQMISSGVELIYTIDEVRFIQNLVYYIENSYIIPDYGIFERGDKANHGLPELNASSIGLATSALESLSDFNLFGTNGGAFSIIHVQIDNIYKCRAVVESMLPNESMSKELAASLLTIIGYPGFTLNDKNLINITMNSIKSKLEGNYGLCRFLRDGYKTTVENPTRLHYEISELKKFENIECEWPLFFTFIIIDAIFQDNMKIATEYMEKLHKISILSPDGFQMIPELYYVPIENIKAEYQNPKSQTRLPSYRVPHLWSQSMYILASLLYEDIISPGDIDPLNRRFCYSSKPELVIQILLAAQDDESYKLLQDNGFKVHKCLQEKTITVLPAYFLNEIYSELGSCKKLNLTGRPIRDVGIISTSILYRTQDKFYAFTPQFIDTSHFYFTFDHDFIEDTYRNKFEYIRSYWTLEGRPTVVISVSKQLLQNSITSIMGQFITKLKTRHYYGIRIQLGSLSDFISTSFIIQWDFMSTCQINQLLDRICLIAQRHSKIVSPIFLKCLPRLNSIQNQSDTMSNIDEQLLKMSHISPQQSLNLSDSYSQVNSLFFEADFNKTSLTFDTNELIQNLETSDNIYENALSLYRLYHKESPEYVVILSNGVNCDTVTALLRDLYNLSGTYKLWFLLRQTAGYLKKQADGLSQSATTILIHQKQFTVGYPTIKEVVVSSVLSSEELQNLIYSTYEEDITGAVLTQEFITYLAMLLRTDAKLFKQMIRLRIGLIIQVIAAEFAREAYLTMEKLTQVFLNVSPFFMKTLFYHVISGKEYKIKNENGHYTIHSRNSRISKIIYSISDSECSSDSIDNEPHEEISRTDKVGFWYRRRYLDGSLNRIPHSFFTDVWRILSFSKGISFSGYILKHEIIEEMTPNETKFALSVESALNSISEPEYRQIIIETLMIFGQLLAVCSITEKNDSIIQLNDIIKHANGLFLSNQNEVSGDAISCCAGRIKDLRKCSDSHGICIFFYDSAPGGEFGTISFITKSIFEILLPHSIKQSGFCNTV